jgi:hypothetical protein
LLQSAPAGTTAAGSGGVSTRVGSSRSVSTGISTGSAYLSTGCDSSSGAQQLLFGCRSIQEQLQEGQLAVQESFAAAREGVLRVDRRPDQAMLPAFTENGWVAHIQLAAHLSAYGHDMLLPCGGETSFRARMEFASGRLLEHLLEGQQGASRTLMQLGAAFQRDLLQLQIQQEQKGPPPLWLQCLLQHTVNTARPRQSPAPGQPIPRWGGLYMPYKPTVHFICPIWADYLQFWALSDTYLPGQPIK